VTSYSTCEIAIEAVLFDRDGTLIEDVPYNSNVVKIVPKAGAVGTVAAIKARRLKTGVVTNQSGIARGLLTLSDVENVNHRVDELFGSFDVWGVCPHAPNDGCSCRKPAPGLVIEAAIQLDIRPQQIVVIGDRRADLGAASAAGAIAVLMPSECTEPDAAIAADLVLSTMNDLVGIIDSLRGHQP